MAQVHTVLAASALWPWSGPYLPVAPKEYIPVQPRSFLTSSKTNDVVAIGRDRKIEEALRGKTASIFTLVELTGMNLKTMRGKVRKWQEEGKVVCVNEDEYTKNPLTRRLYTLAETTGRNQ